MEDKFRYAKIDQVVVNTIDDIYNEKMYIDEIKTFNNIQEVVYATNGEKYTIVLRSR